MKADYIREKLAAVVQSGKATIPEIAKSVEVDPTTIRRILAGKQKTVSDETSERICAWLGIHFDFATFAKSVQSSTRDGISSALARDGVHVHVRTVGLYGVAHCMAKPPAFGDVVPDSDYEVPQVLVPPELNKIPKLAAFTAADSSMEPTVNEGDILFMDSEAELKDGNICLIKFDDTVLCKRWYPSGDFVNLSSDAPGQKPLTIHKREIAWVYRVIRVVSSRAV